MGLLDFLSNTLNVQLLLLQEQILKASELRKDNIGPNSKELLEFRKYIIKILSGSIFLFKAKQILNITELKMHDPIYRKVISATYHQVLPFYKSYIQNDRIIIGAFNNENYKNNTWLNIEFHAKNREFESEINEGFSTGNSYFFSSYETEEFDEEYGCFITGEKHYFSYLKLLFISDLKKNGKSLKLEMPDLWHIDISQFSKMETFNKLINTIINNMKINSKILIQ